MSEPAFRVRRATVDDLEGLRNLWSGMGLPVDGMEKHITEFQVAELVSGGLCGALGLEISGRQGRLHGEAFLDFAHADELRGLFWQRLQLLAANHGVARFWTEETAPFWKQTGFATPDDAALKKLPTGWAHERARWLTLQLWDEDAVEKSLAREMAKFKAEEQVQISRTMRRSRVLKFAATMLAVLLAIFVGIFALRLLASHFESLRR